MTIPALATTAPPFQPTKLCRTVDEAKTLAAEFVLQQLGIPLDGEGCSINIQLNLCKTATLKGTKNGYQDGLMLNAGQKYCRMEHSSCH